MPRDPRVAVGAAALFKRANPRAAFERQPAYVQASYEQDVAVVLAVTDSLPQPGVLTVPVDAALSGAHPNNDQEDDGA